MNVADIIAQIESDLNWRLLELRTLRRAHDAAGTADEQDTVRKSLVVMLYAHLEGFTVTALSTYLAAVNKERVARRDLCLPLAATSMEPLMEAINSGDEAGAHFGWPIPWKKPGMELRRLLRSAEFLDRFSQFETEEVLLPLDYVDAQSNLKPNVLRLLLYRLGLQYALVDTYEALLHNLLKRRNEIAHGANVSPIRMIDYDPMEVSVFALMDELKRAVVRASLNGEFIR